MTLPGSFLALKQIAQAKTISKARAVLAQKDLPGSNLQAGRADSGYLLWKPEPLKMINGRGDDYPAAPL